MEIKLDYGKSGLTVNVPDKNLVKILSMSDSHPISDTYIEITKSLLSPIGFNRSFFDIAKDKKSACILICDITRPVPNPIILPPMLKTLHAAGLNHDDILILIATGIHRPNEGDELLELVGKEIASKYRVENHVATDIKSHEFLGKTKNNTDVWIDKRFVNADFKIATGFIEPHLMAGFSGGRKLVVPGIASIETVKVMHGAKILSHENAREGIIKDNPFHKEALEIAKMAGVDFILNVALNENKKISGIFSGELEMAHNAGIEFVKSHVKDTVPEPVDIVVTTSAGYPLDATYYQTIKGLTAALSIVKEGGTIIIASECSEGIGSDHFTNLVKEYKDLAKFKKDLFSNDFFVIDQWQFQEYVKVAEKANVVLVSGGLSKKQKDEIHINWSDTVEEAIQNALKIHSKDASIAVIPKGPYILANIE